MKNEIYIILLCISFIGCTVDENTINKSLWKCSGGSSLGAMINFCYEHDLEVRNGVLFYKNKFYAKCIPIDHNTIMFDIPLEGEVIYNMKSKNICE